MFGEVIGFACGVCDRHATNFVYDSHHLPKRLLQFGELVLALDSLFRVGLHPFGCVVHIALSGVQLAVLWGVYQHEVCDGEVYHIAHHFPLDHRLDQIDIEKPREGAELYD